MENDSWHSADGALFLRLRYQQAVSKLQRMQCIDYLLVMLKYPMNQRSNQSAALTDSIAETTILDRYCSLDLPTIRMLVWPLDGGDIAETGGLIVICLSPTSNAVTLTLTTSFNFNLLLHLYISPASVHCLLMSVKTYVYGFNLRY